MVLGAALWTLGLFTATGVVITQFLSRNPHWGRTFHSPFMHALPAGLVAVA